MIDQCLLNIDSATGHNYPTTDGTGAANGGVCSDNIEYYTTKLEFCTVAVTTNLITHSIVGNAEDGFILCGGNVCTDSECCVAQCDILYPSISFLGKCTKDYQTIYESTDQTLFCSAGFCDSRTFEAA